MRISAIPVHAAAGLAAGLIVLAALSACKKETATDSGNASGQILPGSASDAMLQEDRVTSQPPLDPGTARATRSAPGADATAAAPEATEAPPAQTAPEPAATSPAG